MKDCLRSCKEKTKLLILVLFNRYTTQKVAMSSTSSAIATLCLVILNKNQISRNEGQNTFIVTKKLALITT